MSRSTDTYKGKVYRQKYRRHKTKAKRDKKRFVWQGEGWSTKAQGGPGNKRAWGSRNGMSVGLPKWLWKRKKQGVFDRVEE